MAYDALLRDTNAVIEMIEQGERVERDEVLSLLKCLKFAVMDLRVHLPSEKKYVPAESDSTPVDGKQRRHNSDRLGGVGLPL